MSRIEKLKKRFLDQPSDFTWEELTRLLSHFGYRQIEGSGSRACFQGKNLPQIRLHKPHSPKVVRGYAMKDVKELLEAEGLL